MSNAAEDLEAALLARAEQQAREYLDGATQRRQQILAEAQERLRLREEREELAARAAADKQQRQQVQSAEIRLAGDYDRLRWTLVQSVLTQLDESLARLAHDDTHYFPILAALIRAGASNIDATAIQVQVNTRDLARLSERWDTFSRDLAHGKTLQLSPQTIHCSGGAILHDEDNRVRIDQTFEGRKQRLGEALTQTVLEKLFTAAAGVPRHG